MNAPLRPIFLARLGGRPLVIGSVWRNADVHNCFAISALWVVIIALLSPIGDFPLNDDWVYGAAAKSILDSGRFRLLELSQPSAFAQAYWGALFCRVFGFSFTTLRFSTLILGLGGVLATYALLRELKAAPSASLIGASAVAANPLYFGLSNSFMTDVPFYFFAVASLLLMARGFQRNEAASLALGILMSYLATLTRLYGLILPLAYAVAFFWTRPATLRTVVIALGPLLVGLLLHFSLQNWMEAHGRVSEISLRDVLQRAFHDPITRLAHYGLAVLLYVGLFVLPSALIIASATFKGGSAKFRRHMSWRVCGLTILLFTMLVSMRGWMPFSGNVLTYFGIGPLTLRDTYILGLNSPPAPPTLRYAWMAVSGLAALGSALLLDRCWDVGLSVCRSIRAEGRGALGAVTVLLVLSFTGFVVQIVGVSAGFFDRYMLPCIPFALILLSERSSVGVCRPGHASLHFIAWLLVAISAAFSFVSTHDYLAWNSARWSALTNLTTREGLSPGAIDGGYEFNGWHLYEPGYREQPGKSWWWVKDDDYIIASGQVPGYQEIASYPFRRWLPPAPSRIVVLRKSPDREAQ